ncbi:type VI secretion system Vgr family protein [Colwellia sp. MEBiC06753]
MRSQEHRLIAISTPLAEDKLLFYKGSLIEELGRPFHYALDLLSEDDGVELSDLLGQNITLRLETAEDEPRYFNGFVTEFHQKSTESHLTHYVAIVKPWFWLLSLSENCRIFQEKNTPDIIKNVFDELGFSDYEDRLTNTYAAQDYVVQYNESDFNFVSRLMEEVGIFYFFEHINGKHTLILVDQNSTISLFGEVIYLPMSEQEPDNHIEVISSWENSKKVKTSGIRLTSFDFEVPSKNLEAVASVPTTPSLSAIEKFSYPGNYKERNEGTNYTRLLMERENADFEIKSAKTNIRQLGVGLQFKLTEHFREDQNTDYLITKISMELYSDDYVSGDDELEQPLFTAQLNAIPSKVHFRTPLLARKPSMQGPQTAMVVGKNGEEVWTDKYGRIKVLFHWDRYAKANETSSCWVRVSQTWAGKNWGAMQIPRIGQEVLVDFLGGDPDRPIVIGSVYNGSTMPPYELPANHTRSGFKSRSTKGGGGFNEIRLDDKKDNEQLFIHAEKNQDNRVKNDRLSWVGNDAHEIIKANSFALIEKDKHQTIKGNDFSSIEENQHLDIKGGFFTQVTKTFNGKYLADYKMSVGGDSHWQDEANYNHKVAQQYSLNAGKDIQMKASMNMAAEAGMAIHIKAGMNLVLEAGVQVTLKVGGSFVSVGPAGVDISGPLVKINSGGAAGSGSGSKPIAPKAIKTPKEAKEAKEADNDKAGGQATAPKAKKIDSNQTTLKSQQVGAFVAQPIAAAAVNKSVEPPPNCKIKSLTTQCSHSRKPDANYNLLEVVPTATEQKEEETTIKLDGASLLSADDQNASSSTGRYGQAVNSAASSSSNLPNSNKVGSASYVKKIEYGGSEKLATKLAIDDDCGTGQLMCSSDRKWLKSYSKSFELTPEPADTDKLGDTPARSYFLQGKCEHHSGEVLEVKVYPSEQVSAEVSLQFISGKMDQFNKAWEQWGSKFMGLTPLDLKPKLIPPSGKLSYSKGWKENSKDWRAYYEVEFKASLEPIAGIEIEVQFSITRLIGTMVGIPPHLAHFASEHIADVLVLFETGVNLKSSGSVLNQYYSTGECMTNGQITLGVEGKLSFGFMARAGSQYLASVSASGRLAITPYGGGEVDINKDGMFIEPKLKLPPATATVKVEFRAFVMFSKSKTKQWKLWESDKEVECRKYQLV